MPYVVKKYSCFCLTEQTYVTTWSETLPTVCPNNKDHLIDENNIAILDTMQTQSVFIQGKAYDTSMVQGMYLYHGNILNVGHDDSTTQDVVFKVPSAVYGLTFVSGETHRGDYIDVIMKPDTACGVLTATVSPGATTLQVDSNVLQSIKVGWYVTLDNGTTQDSLGMVLEVNVIEGTITVDKPVQHTFAPWLTTVKYSVYIVKDYGITEAMKHTLGYGNDSSLPCPANTIFRMVYHNNSGIAKVLNYSYEYSY